MGLLLQSCCFEARFCHAYRIIGAANLPHVLLCQAFHGAMHFTFATKVQMMVMLTVQMSRSMLTLEDVDGRATELRRTRRRSSSALVNVGLSILTVKIHMIQICLPIAICTIAKGLCNCLLAQSWSCCIDQAMQAALHPVCKACQCGHVHVARMACN